MNNEPQIIVSTGTNDDACVYVWQELLKLDEVGEIKAIMPPLFGCGLFVKLNENISKDLIDKISNISNGIYRIINATGEDDLFDLSEKTDSVLYENEDCELSSREQEHYRQLHDMAIKKESE